MKIDDNRTMDILFRHQGQIQTIFFILDYLIEKLEIKPEDLNKYVEERTKELRKKMQEQNIIVPPQ